eukprot:33017-Eustigmatos_ZCMA.PRE.1
MGCVAGCHRRDGRAHCASVIPCAHKGELDIHLCAAEGECEGSSAFERHGVVRRALVGVHGEAEE